MNADVIVIKEYPEGTKFINGTPFLQAHGNSMLNATNPKRSIPNGSWVALKSIPAEMLQWGEVYAFEDIDGINAIKKIMPSEKEGCIKCVSFNEDDYPPFDIPKKDIISSFCLVMGVVTVKMFN